MSTGADPKTLPITKEYEDGYERIFGKDHKPTRGTFIWDSEKMTFVPIAEYKAPERAIDAPVMAGRFYENTCAPDAEKTDIGSRRKHQEYMKERGLTNPSDFRETWAKQEEARKAIRNGAPIMDPERRREIGKIAYEVEKRGRRNR